MNEFIIFTDSACDLAPEILKEWGVESLSLTFRFDGEDKEYGNHDIEAPSFYNKMRDGSVAKTSAINTATFKEAFETVLKEGKDVLYLAFSSGLSTTCNSVRMAADELREEYPDRLVRVVDTLCASAGQGLLLYFAVEKAKGGASLEETAVYTESLVPHLCHWFTVDDLVYLKRGGRISPAVAFVGGVLGIKPVLHMDNEGHLISRFKVRGRKASITALANKYTELAQKTDEGVVFISHGDCLEDAEALAAIIKEKHGVETKIITFVGPVIGAHSGPGTLALFFLGKER